MTLFEAVRSGDVAAVKKLLKSARDVNEQGPENRTPLIEAAAAGRADLVKLLLDAGADATLKDDTPESAILKAGANGHANVVALLDGVSLSDDRDMARSFLKAHGISVDKAFVYDPAALHPETAPEEPGALHQKAVDVAARAANFFGHEDPLKRLERSRKSKK